jgi:uncharacterized repeat protein (TIGR03803 family)
MRSNPISLRFVLALATLAIAAFASTPAAAQTETILHNFQENNIDGFWPSGTLIFDRSGKIYGTTGEGGAYGYGTVFAMKPELDGSWDEVVLHSFNNNGSDGSGPYSGPAFDASGNIFGATRSGGAYAGGTVYELERKAGGFAERVIHSFGNGSDGNGPNSSLIFDGAGNIYGTTLYGGANGDGTVFELRHMPSGGWAERILFNFNGTNGSTPSFLMFDSLGNIFGTASGGGAYSAGVTYELIPGAGGVWVQQILYTFLSGPTDGKDPGPLVFDTSGNLYGTTFSGGPSNLGTLYELSPAGGGSWNESVLHYFPSGINADAYWPVGDLLIDASGNLYGPSAYGGNYGYGTVFEFSPAGGGSWTETLLHNFGSGTDGQIPTGGLVFDASGNIFGTTYSSFPYTCEGILGCGTVFEITR